jgi:hypothetical protein
MVASMIPSSWQIPAFNCVELAPKQAKYALCIFVINEGERLSLIPPGYSPE